MSKKKLFILVLVVIILATLYWAYKTNPKQKNGEQNNDVMSFVANPKNCSYRINKQNIQLVNGYAEEDVAPNSITKTITRYFGNEVSADFNNDGTLDTAFILTQSLGDATPFYYLAVALSDKGRCRGSNAVLLGDRIAPRTTEFINGNITANYITRDANETMTETPSIGASRYFQISGDTLIEVNK